MMMMMNKKNKTVVSKSLVFTFPVHPGGSTAVCCLLARFSLQVKPSQEQTERSSGGFSLLMVNVVGVDIPT